MSYSIIQADILEWAKSYDGPLFHALLCDAPYEMEFMGKGWDNSGVAFNPETWKAIARCLHPGAFLFVFAGTINDDLISVAMRQAGLRKYHKAGAWVYGSGFPKAARLDTVIDRRAGVERTKIGQRRHQPKFDAKGFEYRKKDNGYNSKDRETFDITAPATELAATWQGHRYGGQVLKPALESILIFQKPYEGNPVSSITATGAGAMNIDGGRIAGDVPSTTQGRHPGGIYGDLDYVAGNRFEGNPAGRWPANLILTHSPRCNGDCAPECAVRRVGEQSGETEATRSVRVDRNTKPGYEGGWQPLAIERGHNDTGTAARFFFNADYVAERLEDADAVLYRAKASRGERENGLDPEQIDLLRQLYGREDDQGFDEATINDGRKKSIDNPYQRGETTRRNIHPTVKPISLSTHLAKLLLPPNMYAPRRLLVPFAGVASEVLGGMFAGFEEVVGVELEAEHVAIAQARIAWWQTMMRQTHASDPGAILKAYGMTNKAKPDSTERWPAGSLFESLEEE